MRARRKMPTTTIEYLGVLRRLIRGAGRRVAWEDPEMLAELVALQGELEIAILEAVQGQRRTGITWQSIAEATGTSKPAAVQKWAHASLEAKSERERRNYERRRNLRRENRAAQRAFARQ